MDFASLAGKGTVTHFDYGKSEAGIPAELRYAANITVAGTSQCHGLELRTGQ